MTGRDRMALSVVVAVAALAAYWFLLLSPKRNEANAVKTKVTAQEQRLAAAQRLLVEGQRAKVSYAANYTAVARLGKAVPAGDDVPSLLYQLDSAGDATGVDFRAIELQTSLSAGSLPGGAGAAVPPGGAPPAPTPAAGAAPPAGQPAAAGAPAPGTAANPAAATQAATATLPPGAIVGPAGLGTLPFSFHFHGGFNELINFVGQVQRYTRSSPGRIAVRGRLMTFNGIGMSLNDEGYPRMRVLLNATAYVLPVSEGLTNGATPSAPAQGGPVPAAGSGQGLPATPAANTTTP